MTWLLVHRSGRVLARGSYASVLAWAEENGFARILTCGHHTGDATWAPQMMSRDVRFLPARDEGEGWRAAA